MNGLLSNEAIGDRLRLERLRLGLNQEQLADKAGVHKNSIINYEQGKRAANTGLFAVLHDLGVDVGYIISGIRNDGSLGSSEQMLLEMFVRLSQREKDAVLALISGLTGLSYDMEKVDQTASVHEKTQVYRGPPQD